jgi:starch synthase
MNTSAGPNCVIRIPAKDSYSTSGPSLMGRQSANEGFLTSWFRYSEHAEFWCMARFRDEAQVFARIGEQVHHAHPSKPVYRWIAQQQIHRIRNVGTLYAPGPQVADLAWMRRRDAQASATDFSIVGMTHTSCELSIQDGLANMLTAPVYPWDAQICPSVSVQTMLQRLLDDEAAWLREHVGATRVQSPPLPVLPLGVHCAAFDLPTSDKTRHRARWREQWALNDSDVCVLYMGRLDLRTKANLLPMLDALQLAAQQLQSENGPRLHLVLAGWFACEWDETQLRAAAYQVCPDVRVVFEDGRTSDARYGVWHAADLFTSLVDNIQETFGLTPIEAMAAGLPVVVSDYDGYRESVRDGVDGIRIRTWQPAAGEGIDLMDGHADVAINYRDYVSRASAFIGLDIAQAAKAYAQLASDPVLRHRMGQAGQQRARNEYDWERLIPRYMALFEELARVRQQAHQVSNWHTNDQPSGPHWGHRHPRRSDPFHSFSHYPTHTLAGALTLLPGPLLPTDPQAREKALAQQLERPVYAGIKKELDTAQLQQLLHQVAQAPQGLTWSSWSTSTAETPPVRRHLGWLIKTGLVRVA